MADITLRNVKGSPLTNTEVDDNFNNLNQAVIALDSSVDSLTANIDSTNQAVIALDSSVDSLTANIDSTTSSLVVNESGADVDFRVESNTDANAFFLEGSSGNVGIGTSLLRSDFSSITPRLQVEATSVDGARVSITSNDNSVGAAGLFLAKTRSASNGGVTTVQSNDQLGAITFLGADGTNIVGAASIGAEAEGTIGTNIMPGRLLFSTTAAGGSSPTERMRIDSSGNLLVGTTTAVDKLTVSGDAYVSGGIHLGGTGSANYLDDYEEGTWTPTYSSSVGYDGATGINVTLGRYTKIGNTVHCVAEFNVSGSGANNQVIGDQIILGGLPFLVRDDSSSLADIWIGGQFSVYKSLGSGIYGTGTVYVVDNNELHLETEMVTGDIDNNNAHMMRFTYHTNS